MFQINASAKSIDRPCQSSTFVMYGWFPRTEICNIVKLLRQWESTVWTLERCYICHNEYGRRQGRQPTLIILQQFLIYTGCNYTCVSVGRAYPFIISGAPWLWTYVAIVTVYFSVNLVTCSIFRTLALHKDWILINFAFKCIWHITVTK